MDGVGFRVRDRVGIGIKRGKGVDLVSYVLARVSLN